VKKERSVCTAVLARGNAYALGDGGSNVVDLAETIWQFIKAKETFFKLMLISESRKMTHFCNPSGTPGFRAKAFMTNINLVWVGS
jgi:hypothetical protein